MTDARPPIPEGLVHVGVVAIAEDRALAALTAAARDAQGTPLEIGAGTVLTIAAAERAIDAGASFLVSPYVEPELIEWAAERGVPFIPGAFTPTEILGAWRGGAPAVKLFPASVAGAAFVREFRGPFPHIPLLPTGGVTIDTAPDFIRAGAIAVGLGSWLIGDGEPTGVADRASGVVRAVADARGPR